MDDTQCTSADYESFNRELTKGMDTLLIPEYMQNGVLAYVLAHRQPGHFLMALFQNDLAGTIIRADGENLAKIEDWVMLLYNYTPDICWGSPAKVEAWLERGRHHSGA